MKLSATNNCTHIDQFCHLMQTANPFFFCPNVKSLESFKMFKYKKFIQHKYSVTSLFTRKWYTKTLKDILHLDLLHPSIVFISQILISDTGFPMCTTEASDSWLGAILRQLLESLTLFSKGLLSIDMGMV